MKKILLFTAMLSFIIILSGCGSKKKSELSKFGDNLNSVQMSYSSFLELGKRQSWGLEFVNIGEDLHGCSVNLDEHNTEIKNIQQNSGFLGGLKKPLGSNTFEKNMKIKITDNSDFSQNEIFLDKNNGQYPKQTWPKKITLTCDEGSDTWDLEF